MTSKIKFRPAGDSAIAARLVLLRKAAGLTQEQLCSSLGIGQSTYAGYEVARRTPPVTVIRALSREYGVSVSYIFGDDIGESGPGSGIVYEEAPPCSLWEHIKGLFRGSPIRAQSEPPRSVR